MANNASAFTTRILGAIAVVAVPCNTIACGAVERGARSLGRRKGSPVQGQTESLNYSGVILPILGNLPDQVGRHSFTS